MKRRIDSRRVVLALAALFVGGPLLALAVVWAGLPSVDALHTRARAPSSKIVDRNGRLLYEVIDPRDQNAGHNTPLALAEIPLNLRNATIAVEDGSFYSNPGVDVIGIARALWINIRGGEARAGGSTITQQLARILLFDDEERQSRTVLRKVREVLLATQITLRYSKDEILALYLNEAYYGNLAYGVDAAARAYFGKSAKVLDLNESAFLAGLPQAPIAYDPFHDLPLAKKRQAIVLDLMRRAGLIDEAAAVAAAAAPLALAPSPFHIQAPHFVAYVRRSVERDFGTERLLRGGLIVTTTLDLNLDSAAQDIMLSHLRGLAQGSSDAPARNANNGAIVVLDTATGEIRAMVGSPDYFNASISGAVNATVALRQPGSAIKPITYAAALERLPGFTAATPLFDVRTAFRTREGLPYVPVNYDRRFHGVLSARAALATSSNVAAVSVLDKVGIRTMLGLAHDMGLHSLADVDRYGLSLTLGGGEVRLLELTAAFGTFAASGATVAPFAITEIADIHGEVLYRRSAADVKPKTVLDPRVAWLISDILSDNAARTPAFGEGSVLRLARPAAVKTGTTTDFRDNWTVGYTPQLVVGVWVGNANGEPMQSVSGVSGAGPIWHDVMALAHRALPVRAFAQPPGLQQVTVCALSGLLPGDACTLTRSEWFLSSSLPAGVDTWHRLSAGQLMFDLPVELRGWAALQGWPLAGVRVATAGNPGEPVLQLAEPDDGTRIRIDKRLPRSVQQLPLVVRVDNLEIVRLEVRLQSGQVLATVASNGGRAFWPLSPGEHTFIAHATLRDGTELESAPVRVTVFE